MSFLERHRFLLAFALLSTLMGTSVGIAKVATSLYALDLHAGETALGLIAASQVVGALLVSVPVGVLVDRYGPARPFLIGTLVAGTAYVVLPLVPSIWFLLICTTVISCFMPMRFVSLSTVFMRELEHIGVGKAGWYRGTHMVGMMLLGPAISVAATQAVGFVGTYWLIAGLFALTIVVSPIVFGRYGAGVAADAATRARSPRTLSRAELRAQLSLIVREPALRRTCIVELAAQSVNGFFAFFIIIIAVRTLSLGEGRATQFVSLEGAAYMIALLFFGTLVARLGDERVYRGSFALATIALLTLATGSTPLVLSIGSVLLGLGLGTLQIVNLTRFAYLGARLGRGKVAGLTPLMGTAGSLLGSLLGGMLGQVIGLQRVFFLYAASFALLALLARAVKVAPVTAVEQVSNA